MNVDNTKKNEFLVTDPVRKLGLARDDSANAFKNVNCTSNGNKRYLTYSVENKLHLQSIDISNNANLAGSIIDTGSNFKKTFL